MGSFVGDIDGFFVCRLGETVGLKVGATDGAIVGENVGSLFHSTL